MFNLSKKLKALEERIKELEAIVMMISQNAPTIIDSSKDLSYEEVIEEWLNGRKK
ncbi:MAG: hypothetical protein J6B34_04170 [Clostridia bacterium]|nr:hypothetical protein [Clostridia bacterium]